MYLKWTDMKDANEQQPFTVLNQPSMGNDHPSQPGYCMGIASGNANESPPEFWWINHGTHGHVTMRRDEAECAAEAGATVHHYPVPHGQDPEPGAWVGLTETERDRYVGELIDYGTEIALPLYAVVDRIEMDLRQRNATHRSVAGAVGMEAIREKLARFGREWFDALTTIGMLRRVRNTPASWEMTAAAESILAQAARPADDEVQPGDARLTVPAQTASLAQQQNETILIGDVVYVRAGGFREDAKGRNLPVFIAEENPLKLERGSASPAALTDRQIAAQDARYEIDGAITCGRMGTNKPPTGHWLTEYWSIGRGLARLGETSAWENQTPVAAPSAIAQQAAHLDEAMRKAVVATERRFAAPSPSASAQQDVLPAWRFRKREGGVWVVKPPVGDEWVAFQNTPAYTLIEAIHGAQQCNGSHDTPVVSEHLPARLAAPEPSASPESAHTAIPGCVTMSYGDGIVTLRFDSEYATQRFMCTYGPSVEIDAAPSASPGVLTAVSIAEAAMVFGNNYSDDPRSIVDAMKGFCGGADHVRALLAASRAALTVPEVTPRRPYDADSMPGYVESDNDYAGNNMEAVVWFLDNRDMLAAKLAASPAATNEVQEAFMRVCEALGIAATACAYLEVPRLLGASPTDQGEDARRLDWMAEVKAELRRTVRDDYMLCIGSKAIRTGKTPRDAIDAAMSSSQAGA
ncbi:hypothetical protein [Cupriavidus sp. TMH.W2]|uniref:hypothetical protein n=1 Tax=Cupriavidus sp. TMH.W2 TaxID=3434465 RepID=UPI003D779BA0